MVPSNRLVALDLLRGYFLYVMVIDHLERFPGLFDLLTGRGRLWVSAAEGFFFISGMVVAIARNREATAHGFRAAVVNILKRAATLYAWSVGLTLFFTYITFKLGEDHMGMKGGFIGPVGLERILVQTALLRYTYGWTDFLPHYVIFMLGAPIALWLLRRGWWWAVAGASLVVRLLSPEFDFRWQTLFYGGMIAGFHLHAVEFWFGERQGARRVLAALVLSFAAVTLVASVSIVLLQTQLATLGWSGATLARWNDQLAPYFDKGLLPWPRLVMFALWFGAIYIVFRRYEAPIAHYVGWFLLPLGRNSLYAYIVHALLVLATASTIAHPAGLIGNIAISTGVLGVMWLCTVNRLGMGIIPR